MNLNNFFNEWTPLFNFWPFSFLRAVFVAGDIFLFQNVGVDVKVDWSVLLHLLEAEVIAQLLHLSAVQLFAQEPGTSAHNLSQVLRNNEYNVIKV